MTLNRRYRILFWFILVLLQPSIIHCQWLQSTNDTLVDVFPLSVGNQWTYRYSTVVVSWPSGNPGTTLTDSGRVTYSISGCTTDADSTSWQFQVRRDLVHHEIFSSLGGQDRDTTYSVRDTSYFDLIESHQGQHQVYRNADPYWIRYDVFPFTRNYVDTTMIYRFRQVGPGDTATFLSWISLQPGPYFRSTFTFKKGVGLIRNSYNSGTIDFTAINDHFLLNSIITSVTQRVGSSAPSSFSLYQNYPNPFNPSTTIRFSVPTRSRVRLSIFNLLGQKVAELVNDEMSAGGYERTWNANVSSGMYFYPIEAVSVSDPGKRFVDVKKMIFVK